MENKHYPADVGVYELDESERSEIERLVAEARSRYGTAADPDFLFRAASLAARLPVGLVDFLRDFQLHETTSGAVVTGFSVDDKAIGPTPAHWSAQPDPASTAREEMFFVLLGTLLGEPFGWSTLQAGRLIHDVIPVRGEEFAQSGHGSTANLEWHTEDGFHPFRCDYLCLMAMRNNTGVATTFGSMSSVELPADARQVLFEPRFLIRPDDEHLRARGMASSSVHELANPDTPVPVLFGSPEQPYLRIDPYFMDAVADDDDANFALKTIVAGLDDVLDDLILEAGDVGIIDNYRAVHGRRPFEARHDGTDRWLKKIVVTRDLRKSRRIRSSARSRVLT
jgi:Fe(II)/alpha-ketoglutarate-dependent arginine beta-hydroxylase